MRPNEAFQRIADIITETTKRPYRDEPLTDEEWSVITDRILLLAKEEKANGKRNKAA